MHLGVIGLGAIGLGVSRNLVANGHTVAGFDLHAEPLQALGEAGGTPCASAGEAVSNADLVLICVFDQQQATDVLFGGSRDGGDTIVERMRKGAIVLMHTTMAPQAVDALAERLGTFGHPLVDAPVTGGKAGADTGTLTAILSGDAPTLEHIEPVMNAYCARRYVVGEKAGAATTVKMVNQLLMGVHLAATAEAVALAEAAGADAELVREVITHGTGFSRAFESRAAMMANGNYDEVRGALDIFVKDLGLVTDMARSAGASTPLGDTALDQFRQAAARGLGTLDCAALIEIFRTRNRSQ